METETKTNNYLQSGNEAEIFLLVKIKFVQSMKLNYLNRSNRRYFVDFMSIINFCLFMVRCFDNDYLCYNSAHN